MLHCHHDRTGKQIAVISPIKNASFVCIVKAGLSKGKNLLIVVDVLYDRYNNTSDRANIVTVWIMIRGFVSGQTLKTTSVCLAGNVQ